MKCENLIFIGEEADVELEDMFGSWPAEFTDTQDKAMQTKMPIVKVSQSGKLCEIEDDEDEEEGKLWLMKRTKSIMAKFPW